MLIGIETGMNFSFLKVNLKLELKINAIENRVSTVIWQKATSLTWHPLWMQMDLSVVDPI